MERSFIGPPRSAQPHHRNTMKYKGFTLIEVSLALSLMGILLLMGSEVWNILGQVHLLYSDNQQARYEEIRLRHILEQDLLLLTDWEQADQQIFIKKDQQDTILQYQFQRDFVIRYSQFSIDTFRFSLNLQPFEQEMVVCLEDTLSHIWLKQPIWSKARAIP
ncbi:MAG: type II secretion system protein J [Bacteroidia bacterium]